MSLFICIILFFIIGFLLALLELLSDENKKLYKERNTFSILYLEEQKRLQMHQYVLLEITIKSLKLINF